MDECIYVYIYMMILLDFLRLWIYVCIYMYICTHILEIWCIFVRVDVETFIDLFELKYSKHPKCSCSETHLGLPLHLYSLWQWQCFFFNEPRNHCHLIVCCYFFGSYQSYHSGQIIATCHTTDFPQKVAVWKGNPLISGKSRLVNYYNLARNIGGVWWLTILWIIGHLPYQLVQDFFHQPYHCHSNFTPLVTSVGCGSKRGKWRKLCRRHGCQASCDRGAVGPPLTTSILCRCLAYDLHFLQLYKKPLN